MTSADEPKRLYRILDFTRVVQIFERRELYFANPSKWDDPYERRINHSRSHALFAQCWCQLGISDAMWRIYSQNGMGVRISTTDKKLRASVRSFVKDKGYIFRLGEVDYKSQTDLNIEARKIATELRDDFKIQRAVDALYMKREAFQHESEWRATIFCPDERRISAKDGIAVKIDPHKLIDRILLDPRAPGELVDAFKFYFEKKLGFQGTVIRSVLYKSPKPLEVDDEFITSADF